MTSKTKSPGKGATLPGPNTNTPVDNSNLDPDFLQVESLPFAVSVFDAPVSNISKKKDVDLLEFCRMLQKDIVVLPDNKSGTKARFGKYFVRGQITGERNDSNLTKCCLLILDIDTPLPGKELPTVYEIHDTLGDIVHAVYTSVTPGRSRIVVPVRPYPQKTTSTLTRQLYDFCRSLGLEFAYAGENKTASQPWFYGQTLDKDSFVCLVNNDGDLFIGDPDYIDEEQGATFPEPRQEQDSTNHLSDFIEQLKTGTIHEAVKRHAGWLSRTTNLSMRQIFDDISVLVEAHCSDRDKVQRWNGSERASLEEWFKKNAGQGSKKAPTDPKTYRHTELGNAELFRDQHGDCVRFVAAWKKWVRYDGKRWRIGDDAQIRRLAHKTVKNLYSDAANASDNDMAQKIAKWAGQSCKSNSITAMLREAAALLSIDPSMLDSNPWLFNCENCTIDLKSGNVRPHQKEDFITKITPVCFDPEATAPTFEKTLETCFSKKKDLIDFIRRSAGYGMSGSTKEQCLFIWYGSGANGKTTIIEAISEALGEYAQTTRPETLMVKRGDGIPSDLAKLKGARWVTAAEAEDGHRLAESQIKQITGGERIQARALYQDWFEYKPEFKVILCTNHKPVIRGEDYAIWRRIRLVPFTVTIPEEEQDKNLSEKLKAELPGILKWIVTGAAEWLTFGLGNPEEVLAATECYKTEQSVLNNFLETSCVVFPTAQVEAGQLFQAFEKWRTAEGQRRITKTKFGRMLSQQGFEKSRTSAGRILYSGLGLPTIQTIQNCSGGNA